MAEQTKFHRHYYTIKVISMVGFEEYQHILFYDGEEGTPYDIIKKLVEFYISI